MGAAPPTGAPGPVVEPLDAKYFNLTFGPLTALFKDVSGIGITVPVTESIIPNAQGQGQRLRTAASVQYSPLTCTSGITADTQLNDWFKAVATLGIEGNTKDGLLTLYNAANTATANWTITGAVVSSLKVGSIGMGDLQHLAVTATFDIEKIVRGA